MKLLFQIIKRLFFALLLLFSVNQMLTYLNILIPINGYTIATTYFLGVYGILAILIIQIYIV